MRRPSGNTRPTPSDGSPARSVLRVAHLLPGMATGGRERMVADFCAHAGRWGVRPQVISYDPPRDGRIALPDGVAEHLLDRTDPGFAGALAALLRRERIDVVHAQGHVSAALAAPVARDRPVLATLHVALGSGWRWAPAIARGLRRARHVTAVSADLARRYHWLAGQRAEVIPPGIDLDRFALVEREVGAQPFTVGIAARLHPGKRHVDAIAALRILAREGFACRLRIAGTGALEPSLRAAAAGLDIRFDGDVTDMPGWLAALDASLLPSDHEGTPLALLEACATGLPGIATDVGGIAEALGDAVLLVPRRDPAAIAAAIRRVAQDDSIAAAARKHRHALSLDTGLARYATLYRELASQ